MESMQLFKSSHHFMSSPQMSIQRDHHHDQHSTTSHDSIRRTESAGYPASTPDEVSAAAAAALTRGVSISRSGRYKSKTKQRRSLLRNSLDLTKTTVVFFTDDALNSSNVVDPPITISVDKQKQEISSQVDTRKADASTVAETVSASVKTSESHVSEESRKPSDDSHLTSAHSDVRDNIHLQPPAAEMDESTDL